MRKSKKISAGLAIAALAIGGFAYSNAYSSDSRLSDVQLKTLETLTKDENKGEVVDIPCDPDNGAVCSVPVHLASGVTTTMNVMNCRNV